MDDDDDCGKQHKADSFPNNFSDLDPWSDSFVNNADLDSYMDLEKVLQNPHAVDFQGSSFPTAGQSIDGSKCCPVSGITQATSHSNATPPYTISGSSLPLIYQDAQDPSASSSSNPGPSCSYQQASTSSSCSSSTLVTLEPMFIPGSGTHYSPNVPKDSDSAAPPHEQALQYLLVFSGTGDAAPTLAMMPTEGVNVGLVDVTVKQEPSYSSKPESKFNHSENPNNASILDSLASSTSSTTVLPDLKDIVLEQHTSALPLSCAAATALPTGIDTQVFPSSIEHGCPGAIPANVPGIPKIKCKNSNATPSIDDATRPESTTSASSNCGINPPRMYVRQNSRQKKTREYIEQRKRNNMSVRKCRAKKSELEKSQSERLTILSEENERLKQLLIVKEAEIRQLREIITKIRRA